MKKVLLLTLLLAQMVYSTRIKVESNGESNINFDNELYFDIEGIEEPID